MCNRTSYDVTSNISDTELQHLSPDLERMIRNEKVRKDNLNKERLKHKASFPVWKGANIQTILLISPNYRNYPFPDEEYVVPNNKTLNIYPNQSNFTATLGKRIIEGTYLPTWKQNHG